MINTRFYLHTKESRKGTRSLYMDVHCDGVVRLRQAVGETLKARDWNPKRGEVRATHSHWQSVNARLERLTHQVNAAFREMLDRGQTPSGEDLRRILRPLREQKKEGGALTAADIMRAFGEQYIARQKMGGGAATDSYGRKFKQAAGHLDTFRPGLLPAGLTERAWREFLEYLYEVVGVEDGTVGNHLQAWRVALREAGLPSQMPWLKNTYNSQKMKPDLTWAEVRLLAAHPYGSGQLREAAHAFVIDCQLALRWGDLSSLTERHMVELETPAFGKVLCFRKRQGKTGQPVFVPMPPMAEGLFRRYGMVPVPRAARTGRPNLTEYNKRLKKAAKEAGLSRLVTVEAIRNGHVTEERVPLHKVLSSHSARHTAASRIREAAEYELAELLLGHAAKSNTAIYAHLDPVKTAERILRAWQYYDAPPS